MGFIKAYLNSFQKPEGKVGRFTLTGMNISHTPLAMLALSRIVIAPEDHILDVGCGGGVNISRMLKKAYDGRVCGIDYSEESVRMSRKKNAASLGRRCEIALAGADDIPYANNSFDKVTAFETIYFWKDIEKCFSEVNRVLKGDGTFMIACETYKGGEVWSKIVDGMAVYTPQQLRTLLTDTGFYNVEVKTWLSYICVTAQKKTISEKRKTRIGIFKPKKFKR